MRRALRPFALLAVSALALSNAGCIVAAVGLGAVAAYGVINASENESWADFRSGMDEVWTATIAALRQNGYAVDPGAWHGATEGVIDVEDVRVVVEAHPGNFTRVRVRVGTFSTEDHRRRARLILENVAARVR
jgi:hypothetical protein